MVRGVGWCNWPRALSNAKSRGVGATLGTPSLGLAALLFQASKPSGFHIAAPNFPLLVPRVCVAKRRPPSRLPRCGTSSGSRLRVTQSSRRGREPSHAPSGKAAEARSPSGRAHRPPKKAQLLRTDSPLELPTYFGLRSCVPTNSGSHPRGRGL